MEPPTLSPTVIASPLKRKTLQALFGAAEAGLLLKHLRSPRKVWRALRQLAKSREQHFGEFSLKKVACVDGRYYRGYHVPGWPSAAHESHLVNFLNYSAPRPKGETILDMVLLAITKKCPLSCEHCFEWEELNRAEKLSLTDIKSMVAKFQDRHVNRIMLSGGEPMLRCKDILEVLESARPGTDFWILTSGFHVTLENARQLKDAGLTGLAISLDHFDPQAHNVFRGSPKSWDAAIGAAAIAHQVGLVVTLSLCVTKEFISAENLMAYARLAKQLGVTFIQLVEPRSVGHYSGKNVDLEPEHVAVLDRFYEQINFGDEYLDWPMVTYSGYQQRRVGCRGAGDRFLYVDTDGDIHACPFCQKKSGSALDCSDGSLDESIESVRERGCHKFKSSSSDVGTVGEGSPCDSHCGSECKSGCEHPA